MCDLACGVIFGETLAQVALQHFRKKKVSYKFSPFTMQWSAINYTCLYSNFQGNWFKGSKGWLNPFVSPLCCNASSSSVLAARRPGGILDKMNKNDPRRSLVAHKSMSTVCLLSSVIVLLSSQSAPCEASSVWL